MSRLGVILLLSISTIVVPPLSYGQPLETSGAQSPRDAALTLLKVLVQQDVPLEQLPQKLAEVTAQYKEAIERLGALEPEDPVTRGLAVRADAAIKAGRSIRRTSCWSRQRK
jgi:hypothetical protein